MNAQNQTRAQSSVVPIHEISQTSLNNASAMNVFKILGGKSPQSICCSANVQTHFLSTRLLTIKAGKDVVCGGLSAAGRGKLPACSNEVTLCNSSMTL